MYTLLSGLYAQWNAKSDFYIAIIGLDNAGKTTFLEMVKHLYIGTPMRSNPPPTVGLNIGRIPLTGPGLAKNLMLNFWDLGGQKELHSLWAQYYDEAHGIIFVVDASDKARIEAVRIALDSVLKSEALDDGIPILMLANKQDVQGALSVPEIQSIFNQMAQTLSARDSKVLPIAGLTGEGVKEAIEWMGLRVVRNAMHRPPLQSSS